MSPTCSVLTEAQETETRAWEGRGDGIDGVTILAREGRTVVTVQGTPLMEIGSSGNTLRISAVETGE